MFYKCFKKILYKFFKNIITRFDDTLLGFTDNFLLWWQSTLNGYYKVEILVKETVTWCTSGEYSSKRVEFLSKNTFKCFINVFKKIKRFCNIFKNILNSFWWHSSRPYRNFFMTTIDAKRIPQNGNFSRVNSHMILHQVNI